MGDSAQPIPSMKSPIAASPTDSEGSSDEAMMLWAPFSAPDACSSNEFQLYSLPAPPASPPTDMLSFWLSKYMSASLEIAPAEPPVDNVLAFINTDLNDPKSVVIPNTPEPTLSWFVPSPWPAPDVVLSPCSPPESKCPTGALNSPSSTSTMPALPSSATQIPVPECGALNSPSSTSPMPTLPSSVTEIPVPECDETTPPARRELFHLDSTTVSTQDNHYSLNTNICTTDSFGLPGHQFMSATQESATSHANSVEALSVAALFDLIFGRQQSAPIRSWSADVSWNSGQQTMIPHRRSSWESWLLLPPVVVAAAPMPAPMPPLLSSLGSPSSWSPRAPEPPAQLSFQTGESSAPSSERANLGVNLDSDPLFWWNRGPSCIMHGNVFTLEPPKELLSKRVTRSATLKGNQKASLGSVANSKLKNEQMQERRKRFNKSLKTLQKLVVGDRKVGLVTLLEMTCNSIIMMEYQIETLVGATPI